MTHLDALQLNLSNERIRLANAKTESERALRKVWVAQLEREIESEHSEYLGFKGADDDLLSALGF